MSKLKPLKYESEITIKDIPIQWVSKFELFYPDLPQFPMVYVHFDFKDKRIYGFPVAASFDISDSECDVKLIFLCNEDLESDEELKKLVKEELEERFGAEDKIGINDIIDCCNGNERYEEFFKELWKYVSETFGDYIPYGQFYEEIFSIIRFVSAWVPKTGRQSEMRMLYNFLSIFGERIKIEGKWSYIEFYLIPHYDDLIKENFDNFEIFKGLYSAIKKIWKIFFNKKIKIEGKEFQVMDKSWPQSKDKFIEKVTYPLLKKSKINNDDKMFIERLVDAFNRHSWRAAFFIWSIMSARDFDYRQWDKDFFNKFYLFTNKKRTVGISPKVIACFLQQGFKNEETIPIDTWVESFFKHVLGIPTKKEFFNKFSDLGKLERVIWLSSQANKTNIKNFFNLLWCQRFGNTGNNDLREANPISCYECKLRKKCAGHYLIKENKMLIKDKKDVTIKPVSTSSGKLKGYKLIGKDTINEADKNNCKFICITEDKVPKKIFVPYRNEWKLTDEFSGYLLKDQKTNFVNKIIKVKKFIKDLPEFKS